MFRTHSNSFSRSDRLHWKSYINARYWPINKDTDGNHVRLRDVHWLNFGWGEDTDPVTGIKKRCYHPDKVWLQYRFSRDQPWKKVRSYATTPGFQPVHPTNPTRALWNWIPRKSKASKMWRQSSSQSHSVNSTYKWMEMARQTIKTARQTRKMLVWRSTRLGNQPLWSVNLKRFLELLDIKLQYHKTF